MKRIATLIVLLSIVLVSRSQNITQHVQHYNIWNDNDSCSIETSVTYNILNNTMDTLLIMFTEDNVSKMSLDKALRRKIFHRYGDFAISTFIFDNIINTSTYTEFPHFFIKSIPPNNNFSISIIATNQAVQNIYTCFIEHLILCNLKQIKEIIKNNRFMSTIKDHKLEYPYSTINIKWENLYELQNENGILTSNTR